MNNTKDISSMTITELKALAYELIVQSESVSKNLQVVNQLITKKSQDELPASSGGEAESLKKDEQGK